MTTTKTISVSGGFHNIRASVTIRAKIDPRGGAMLSQAQAKKIGNHMCPVKGCICGMHHGWEIEGSDRGELSEALNDAAARSYLDSSKNS